MGRRESYVVSNLVSILCVTTIVQLHTSIAHWFHNGSDAEEMGIGFVTSGGGGGEGRGGERKEKLSGRGAELVGGEVSGETRCMSVCLDASPLAPSDPTHTSQPDQPVPSRHSGRAQ